MSSIYSMFYYYYARPEGKGEKKKERKNSGEMSHPISRDGRKPTTATIGLFNRRRKGKSHTQIGVH